MNLRYRISVRSLLACTALISTTFSSSAATFTWNGANASVAFSDGLNWVGGLPASTGSDLIFGQDFGLNLAGLDAGIIFNAPTVTFAANASTGFYITALTSNDILNITGSGTTVTNLSANRMKTDALTVSIGQSQTWNGGAGGLNIYAVDLGNNRTLTFTGTGTTATTQNVISFGIDGTGTSGVTKQGTGTLLFNGSNLYTGATTISQGTLQLGASERIANTSNVVMDGGTFDTGGFDETVGKLSLTNFSVINFGTSNTSDLAFALSSDQNWGAFTITINGFDQGFDTLRFGTDANGLTSSQLAAIRFNGVTPAKIDSNGYVTAVPEPSSAMLLALATAGLLGRRRRAASRKI